MRCILKKLKLFFFLFSIIFMFVSCSKHIEENREHDHGKVVSFTLWNLNYEIFPEFSELVENEEISALIHITDLKTFKPVSTDFIYLNINSKINKKVKAKKIENGIYKCNFKLKKGNYKLTFIIPNGNKTDKVEGALLHIGTEENKGHVHLKEMENHSHDHYEEEKHNHHHDEIEKNLKHNEKVEHSEDEHNHGNGEFISFTKESQWNSDFKTEIAKIKPVYQTIKAYGKILPKAGNEIVLTSPVDGVIISENWPVAGKKLNAKDVIFKIIPKISSEISLEALKSKVKDLKARLNLSKIRTETLKQLLNKGSVSKWEYEDEESKFQSLKNSYNAALSDLKTAEALRNKKNSSEESLTVSAPFKSSTVHVKVTPGQYVTAGTELIHLVKPNPITLELYLSVKQKNNLSKKINGLYIRSSSDEQAFFIKPENVKFLSVTPASDPLTGKISALYELNLNNKNIAFNSFVEAELVLNTDKKGIVIPASSIVDDSGMDTVYVQQEGESFERVLVNIKQRMGNFVFVEGIHNGERIVTIGGNLLRRAQLIGNNSFDSHGHSH